MSRQLFPLLESSRGGNGEGSGNRKLGEFGSFSLFLAIKFGILKQGAKLEELSPQALLKSDINNGILRNTNNNNKLKGAIELV